MAGTDLSDRVSELALAVLDLYTARRGQQVPSIATERAGYFGVGFGRMAKYSGQTEAQVEAQLSGEVEPTAGQAVALCRAIRLAGANGTGSAA